MAFPIKTASSPPASPRVSPPVPPPSYPPPPPTPHHILHRYFGLPRFRQPQYDIIKAILSGQDVFAQLPTGAGKSLCFQLPALILPGITIVISPLLALMQDQIQQLRRHHIPGAAWTSDISRTQETQIVRALREQRLRLLYLSPEKLQNERVQNLLFNHRIRQVRHIRHTNHIGQIGNISHTDQNSHIDYVSPINQTLQISHICLDEAHCVSEWGHDFRPAYQQITPIIHQIKRHSQRPITLSAFTATATTVVEKDIITHFPLDHPQKFYLPYWRPNLRYIIAHPSSLSQQRRILQNALHYWQTYQLGRCLIYAGTRQGCEQLALWCQTQGFPAAAFHAGLTAARRSARLHCFTTGQTPVLVATSAFGMGIDIGNIRLVVHYQTPTSLAAYAQESGRAGRDRQAAVALLLYRDQDLSNNLQMALAKADASRRPWLCTQAEQLQKFATRQRCLTAQLENFFARDQPDHQAEHPCQCSICQPQSALIQYLAAGPHLSAIKYLDPAE